MQQAYAISIKSLQASKILCVYSIYPFRFFDKKKHEFSFSEASVWSPLERHLVDTSKKSRIYAFFLLY